MYAGVSKALNTHATPHLARNQPPPPGGRPPRRAPQRAARPIKHIMRRPDRPERAGAATAHALSTPRRHMLAPSVGRPRSHALPPAIYPSPDAAR